MPKFNQLSKGQQAAARRITEQAWAAGLKEATVSQVAQDMTGWRQRITEAEQSAKTLPEPAKTTIADTIASLRTAGHTIRDIAATVGCAASTVYRWARGTNQPSTRYAAALAAA